MSGNNYVSYDPQPVPLARFSDQIGVFQLKFKDSETVEDLEWELVPLPNILCTEIAIREGAHPPTASFRYIFSRELLPPEYPSRFHHIYGVTAPRIGALRHDDHIVVIRAFDDGEWNYIFDGFVTAPEAHASGGGESVTFTAVGAPVREWDFPLPGAIWSVENFSGEDDLPTRDDESTIYPTYFTEEPARFNPNGKPNACDAIANWSGDLYFTDSLIPAFVTPTNDNLYIGDPTGDTKIRRWTLAMAAQYIVGVGIEYAFGMNTDGTIHRPRWRATSGTPYVSVYDLNAWDVRLQAVVPTEDDEPIDMGDKDSFTRQDIICPDVEVTGDAWPHALEKILAPFGFYFRFDLRRMQSDTPAGGLPEWYLTVYRLDDPHDYVNLYLQDPDDVLLDPSMTNVGSISLAHESTGIANEFEVDTLPVQYEATFILAPSFLIDSADGSDLEQWVGEHADHAKRDYYRRYVFGEGGDQVWNFTDHSLESADPTLIHPLLNLTLPLDDRRRDKFAPRRRPTFGRLVSQKPDGTPYNARVAISTDYAGACPGLWDGTGTWQQVTNVQDWHVLQECIGIRVEAPDPNNWMIGDPREGETVFFDGGKVTLVENLANNVLSKPPFVIALTCCVHSDYDLDALAPRRSASLSRFTVRRKVDRRTEHKRLVATSYSQLAVELEPTITVDGYEDVRDDTKAAQYQADAYRRAHECGSHAGRVEIRRITQAYNVGQTVRRIVGRDVDLQMNRGQSDGESPLYPRIAAINWSFEPEQVTHVTLTDERADPLAKRVALQLRAQGVRHRR